MQVQQVLILQSYNDKCYIATLLSLQFFVSSQIITTYKIIVPCRRSTGFRNGRAAGVAKAGVVGVAEAGWGLLTEEVYPPP